MRLASDSIAITVKMPGISRFTDSQWSDPSSPRLSAVAVVHGRCPVGTTLAGKRLASESTDRLRGRWRGAGRSVTVVFTGLAIRVAAVRVESAAVCGHYRGPSNRKRNESSPHVDPSLDDGTSLLPRDFASNGSRAPGSPASPDNNCSSTGPLSSQGKSARRSFDHA